MLNKRVISAAIMIPLFVLAVLKLDSSWFAGLLAIFVLLAIWEWGDLSGLSGPVAKLIYCLITAGILLWLYLGRSDPGLTRLMLMIGLAWWLLVLAWLALSKPDAGMSPADRFYKPLAGLLVLLPAWYALVILHEQALSHGAAWVLYIFVLVWLADIGAYFAGKRFGRNKLAPRLSPGKTWEGVAGGLLAVGVYAAVVAIWRDLALQQAGMFVLFSVLVALLSVAGDLFESLFKRQAGMKDSSKLIPGHGGVMDRIDSLTAAAPLYVSGMLWLGLGS